MLTQENIMRGRRVIPTTKERLPGESEAQWMARMDRLAIREGSRVRTHAENLRNFQQDEQDRATHSKR
jgi:hypothetical protein